MTIPTLHGFRRFFLCLSATAVLQGCLSSPTLPDGPSDAGGMTVLVQSAPAAARGMFAEPGGRIVAQIRLPGRTWSDSVTWNGSAASFAFPSLPASGCYQVKVLVRDAAGRATHADSAYPVYIRSGSSTSVQLSLRALLGRIVVPMPSVPASVDSLSISWLAGPGFRRTSMARGGSGKTVLRLDSLPVGESGSLSLRAWNKAGDTLFACDTNLAISSQADLSLSLRWVDQSGNLAVGGSILAGGDVQAMALFPGQESPNGSLLFDGFSDSGSADWIRIVNPGSDRVSGLAEIVHGSESWSTRIDLGPGERAVLTRLGCSDSLRSAHPLLSATLPTCGLPLSVSWSSLPSTWELRSPGGALADLVMVEDGKDGWPQLNSGSARTLRRRSGSGGGSSMAGRSWCALATDSPDLSCP